MLHPKPDGLLHPRELWKHTAFENQEEYTFFAEQPMKLGKPTASNPHGGMKQKYHDFANKLWLKFKLVRREIANSTQVLWSEQVPQNAMPSGKGMNEIVENIRKAMFKVWCIEKTSKQSKTVYCQVEMEGRYKDWRPLWWYAWRTMGPPAGNLCSQVFMSECCGFKVECELVAETSALSDQAADAIKTSLALNDQIVANNQKLAKLVYSIESEDEVPKVILSRIKTIEKEIADLQERYEIATLNAQQWSTAAIEQSHQQEAIIEILDKLQTLQGTELHDLRISLSTRIKRVVEKITLYPAGSWMTKDNLAAVKAEMTDDGVLDEASIDNYLLPFSEVKKQERYLIILFKNGESLELAKDHATPFTGDDIKWYGKRPVFWPLARDKFLAST